MHGSHLKLLVIHTVVVQNIYMHAVHRILKSTFSLPWRSSQKGQNCLGEFLSD